MNGSTHLWSTQNNLLNIQSTYLKQPTILLDPNAFFYLTFQVFLDLFVERTNLMQSCMQFQWLSNPWALVYVRCSRVDPSIAHHFSHWGPHKRSVLDRNLARYDLCCSPVAQNSDRQERSERVQLNTMFEHCIVRCFGTLKTIVGASVLECVSWCRFTVWDRTRLEREWRWGSAATRPRTRVETESNASISRGKRVKCEWKIILFLQILRELKKIWMLLSERELTHSIIYILLVPFYIIASNWEKILRMHDNGLHMFCTY